MSLRSSLFLALCAACNATPSQTTPQTTASSVPVPLTAASQSIAQQQIAHEDIQPPWTLTASDGSGLLLSRVEAKAVMEGPLAFTELHLYFFNPENRTREGTFQITLPQGAAVSRFAMETNGQFMEAEVVEKQLARRAYDDFLHRKQDPALLEKAAGNQFTAKVFPIAPNAQKHIVISYSQELPGTQYQLPLRGLPKTERVDVSLAMTGSDGKKTEQKLSQRNWQPDHDFVSNGVGQVAQAVRAGNVIAAQVPIGTWIVEQQAPTGVTLLVDTSASRSLGYASYIASIQKLVASLASTYGKNMPVQIVAFDQDAEPIYSGAAGEFTDMKKLIERGAAGASDLGQALAYVGAHQPLQRVVVVTDGVITAGEEGADLQKDVKALGQAKVDRIDFVLAGGLRDDQAMTALVRTGLPHAGTVLDLDTDPVAKALGEAVMLDVAIDVPGATWVYPRHIPAARAGTHAMVYARMAQPAQSVKISVNNGANTFAVLAGTEPLVERAVASAEINEMEAALALSKGQDAEALRARIAKKSVASRVISSQTSLLVLESDSDYARYGIDRKALADVLVVGANGIERQGRTSPAMKQQIAQPDRTAVTTKTTATNKPPAKAPMAKTETKADFATSGADDTASLGIDEKSKDKKEAFDGQDAPKAAEAPMRVTSSAHHGMGAGGGGMAPGDAPGPRSPRPIAAPPPPATTVPSPEPRAMGRVADVEAEEADEDDRAETQLRRGDALVQENREAWPPRDAPPALTGELAEINKLINRKNIGGALAKARDWHAREPGNVLALVALGDALEANGSATTAARVYGSIIDLFPGRADMRRFAGERLSRINQNAMRLIVDTYKRAVADRPDHMTGHRLYAYSLVRSGKPAEAFDAILAGVDQGYRDDSYRGGDRVLAEDAGMIGASYAAAVPAKKAEIVKQLAKRGLSLATKSSTRFILYWETDGNDVDFHIQDAHGGHAYYQNMHLPSGGDLYADITTGYGPECFAIEGTPKAGPYKLSI
ncbi:MAG TPA: VIT domain-containing protein, partial [Kofleriaceae bacterium]|nr:VIT domain-containing protein [Kofleriaceae bacterium]